MEVPTEAAGAADSYAERLVRWKWWVTLSEGLMTLGTGALLLTVAGGVLLALATAWVRSASSDIIYLSPSGLAVALAGAMTALGILALAGGWIAHVVASARYQACMGRIRASGDIDEAVIDSLLARLRNREDAEYAAAVSVLGDLGNKRATPCIISALEDQRELIRRTAVEALGDLGDKSAVEALVGVLQDRCADVRKEAADVLWAFWWKSKNDDEEIRFLAARQEWDKLVGFGELAVDPVIGLLQDKNAGVRKEAARTLGAHGDARAADALSKLVTDGDAGVRIAVQEALRTIRKGHQS